LNSNLDSVAQEAAPILTQEANVFSLTVNQKIIMKLPKILPLACVAGLVAFRTQGQVYSQNIVGYYNLTLEAGDNYIANQFDNGSGNTLDTIFQTGVVPEGTTFTEWNPTTQQDLPTSTYDTTTGWSIDYQLTLGEGGLLVSPVTFNNYFTGSVWPGIDIPNEPFVPPVVTGTGSLMLSCVIPMVDATFYDVVGRDPQNSESVTMLDGATQTYTTTTFENGAWDNGDPSLNVGESAMFDLEAVPEPGTLSLLGAGGLVLGIVWRRKLHARV
jgi:PEP-CTERM motif